MQKLWKIVLFNCLLIITVLSQACFALPFSITVKAGTRLPTFVARGSSAIAYYTVRNNTNTIRIDNFVKYLPPHVTQTLTDVTFSDPCDINFTLAPKGQPGDRCTLQLQIDGAVNANDPNPH